MMSNGQKSIILQREEILSKALSVPARELKLIAPAYFDNFFKLGQLVGIYDQVITTLDCHFTNSSMSFACTGDSSIPWSGPVTIALDLEFMFNGVFAFFRLKLSSGDVEVELHHISFEDSTGDPDENTIQLANAIRQASRHP